MYPLNLEKPCKTQKKIIELGGKNMPKNKLTREQEQIVNGLTPEDIEKIMTPKNDLIFKKLFGTVGRESMVKDFLEAILETSIKSVTLGKETIFLPEEINEKTGVLDVRVTLDDGTEVDVEMQNKDNTLIVRRSQFYLSRLYQGKIKSGDDYDVLRKAIVIFITNFEVFSDIKEYHTKWLMTEQKHKEKTLDELELHYIELPKFLKTKFDKQRKIDQWLLFIDYSKRELIEEIMEENENVKEAVENMERLKSDEHTQYLAWLREKYTLEMNTAKKVGKKEGLEEGIEQGRKESKKEIVKKLLKAGIDIEVIIQTTELTKEEIEELQKEIGTENV